MQERGTGISVSIPSLIDAVSKSPRLGEARSGTEDAVVTVTVVHGPMVFGNCWVIGSGGKFHRGLATSLHAGSGVKAGGNSSPRTS